MTTPTPPSQEQTPRAADDPRWDDDPSLSFDEAARHAGVLAALDTPDDPAGDIEVVSLKLWPHVHPAFQEERLA